MRLNTEYAEQKVVSILLVGPPLSGKTNLALKMPDVYILDCDDKLGNAVSLQPDVKFFWDSLLRDEKNQPIPEDKRWPHAMKCLMEAIKSKEVKTIVIDSLTALADALKAFIISQPNAMNTKGALMVGGLKVMEQAHWAPFAEYLKKLIATCKSSGKDFLVTAHEAEDKDETTGRISVTPYVQGHMRNLIASYFTDVWGMVNKIGTGSDGKQKRTWAVKTKPDNRMTYASSVPLPELWEFSTQGFISNYKPETPAKEQQATA